MAEQTTSQAQQKPVNPFQKAADENYARMEAYFAEWHKLQERQAKEIQTAIDESAKLMKESFAYANKLAAEWQRISLATAKQATQMVTGTFPS